jgi:hypothetical protein
MGGSLASSSSWVSSGVSFSSAAATLPVSWPVLRAPRITDDTAGRAISQAMAT